MRLNLYRGHRTRAGRLTRILVVLGPTWAGSPVRRLVQVASLILFLVLFLYVCWPYGSHDYREAFGAKEIVNAELFLLLDPVVSISAAIAARTLVWSLAVAGIAILVCMLFPRAFCGYVCPLGTLLDGFDWLIGRRVERFKLPREGWWVHFRYYVLVTLLVAAAFGVLLSGFVAAIPMLTRALLFTLGPVQMGLRRGWYLVPSWNAGHVLSLLLVTLIFGLGLLGRRFWCSYVCPTGAFFSLCSTLRLTERQVKATCVGCGRCIEACSFAAIREDFSTRFLNCTFCQSCAGVCPVEAIEFTSRRGRNESVQVQSTFFSRRGLLAGLGGAVVAGVGTPWAVGDSAARPSDEPAVRPPGSVPEDRFLRLCVRCGQCIKVCPNNVLQPAGFEDGLNGLWTPKVVADWSGCEPSCNNCGQVCPTGAIRALSLAEKRVARIGLADVDRQSCLPYARREACRLCVEECRAAGHDAIEFVRVGGELDRGGEPVEGSGLLAPVVRADQCIGCGLCQMRCHAINVKARKVLHRSAIRVTAGPGREDRIVRGSYLALREERQRQRRHRDEARRSSEGAANEYLPDFLQ